MNKTNLKRCILIDCISFTLVAVILSLLVYIPDAMSNITHVTYLQLFCCTTIISILSYFTFKIQFESQFIGNLVMLFEVAAVIFGVGGGVFQWFPWELKYIIEVIVILVIVFFITNGILIWQNNEIAKTINQKIKERKE